MAISHGYVPSPLDLTGVDPATLLVTLSHPAPLTYVAYDATLGGWQAGFAGTVTSDGTGGYDVTILTHPALLSGLWTVTVAVDSLGGLPGGGSWSFTVSVPPVVTGTGPSGISVAAGAAITFTTTDDTQVVEATISLTLVDPLGATHLPVVAGVVQAGWSGTITANGSNGFDVSVTQDGGMTEGIWAATAYCEDAGAASDSDTWVWYVHSGAFQPWEPVW